MKKIIVFLLVSCLAGGVFAQQTKKSPREQQVIAYYLKRITEMEEYQRFDYYYYNYAVKTLENKELKGFLDAQKGKREYCYGTTRTEDELRQYQYYFLDEQKELRERFLSRQAAPISDSDKGLIQWYAKRPKTKAQMLSSEETYMEYDNLVYIEIASSIIEKQDPNDKETPEAKKYLDKVRVLRQKVLAKEAHADILAAYREVLEATTKAKDKVSVEERTLIEEYLNMPISLNGEVYNMPFDQWKKELL